MAKIRSVCTDDRLKNCSGNCWDTQTHDLRPSLRVALSFSSEDVFSSGASRVIEAAKHGGKFTCKERITDYRTSNSKAPPYKEISEE